MRTDRVDDAMAYLKAALVGTSATAFVKACKPLLGTWQSIFFCEFDGPRSRRVLIRVAEA